MECVVYMGAEDIQRQAINVYRMRLLGAEVVPVTSGSKTLKDALNEAMRDWVTNVDDTFYIIGTVAGPHPYPAMVRDFQAVIGREARAQMLATGRPPAGCAGRLRRRRLQRHRPVPSVPRRRRCRACIGVEGGGDGFDQRPPCGAAVRGQARRSARQPHLSDGRRRRPDHRDAFDFGRPGLSRRRARARLAQRHRPRQLRRGRPIRRRWPRSID